MNRSIQKERDTGKEPEIAATADHANDQATRGDESSKPPRKPEVLRVLANGVPVASATKSLLILALPIVRFRT
jgi:hypothetical protein